MISDEEFINIVEKCQTMALAAKKQVWLIHPL